MLGRDLADLPALHFVYQYHPLGHVYLPLATNGHAVCFDSPLNADHAFKRRRTVLWDIYRI